MAVTEIQEYLRLLPRVKQSPEGSVWLSYDQEADTLYVNYKKPSFATDSELTVDDVVAGWRRAQPCEQWNPTARRTQGCALRQPRL